MDYGKSHGYRSDQIVVAVTQAFYESSLGQQMTNGNFKGLFQYNQATWDDLHHTGSLLSDTDQIKAVFDDIITFDARYIAGQANGNIPEYLTFAEYFEVKHHLGSNSTDWTSPVISEYNQRSANLGFSQ